MAARAWGRCALGVLAAALAVTGSVGARGSGPERGAALFAEKGCERCHPARSVRAAAPSLTELRRPQGAFELAGRLWNHVPTMFALLGRAGVTWPRISAEEMADLMAYLQAEAARDPEPDLFRGQVLVLRKGCLKCHALRREGGRTQPDLAEAREAYASAPAWAAAMWAHTPRMAEAAARMGLPYPRFAAGEMADLVGFLRHVAERGQPPSRARGR